MTGTELLDIAVSAADDKKAQEISILDISGQSSVADYFLVITGSNKIQTRAIADSIQDALAEHDVQLFRKQGYQEGEWILLDYIDVVIHVFLPASREYYQLERLWGEA
ncbi:MAG: ribosome silencing factor [Firmicutes bacterium]|nr:ribosome silencing factor [Bacillota bacterium]